MEHELIDDHGHVGFFHGFEVIEVVLNELIFRILLRMFLDDLLEDRILGLFEHGVLEPFAELDNVVGGSGQILERVQGLGDDRDREAGYQGPRVGWKRSMY